MPSNNQRIASANHAIDAFRDHTKDFTQSTVEGLIDLLSAVRYLCEQEDLDFTAIVRMSKAHVEDEA